MKPEEEDEDDGQTLNIFASKPKKDDKIQQAKAQNRVTIRTKKP